jgi:hypothetical protein
VSPATRFAASLRNATKRPAAEIEGSAPPSEAGTPVAVRLAHVVV